MWEAFKAEHWASLLFISGRMATEEDIKKGCAVYTLPNGGIPCEADLPICGIHIDEESGKRTPVVIIQAEQSGDIVTLGVRYLDGGNGVCLIDEVELLDEPNSEFGI